MTTVLHRPPRHNPRRQAHADELHAWLTWRGGKAHLTSGTYAALEAALRAPRHLVDRAIDDLVAQGLAELREAGGGWVVALPWADDWREVA